VTKPIEHRRREPAPGVFRLILPLPFPGLDRVNCYLLEDPGGSTLVDCGLYLPDDQHDHGWAHVVAEFKACEVDLSDVTKLVVTHAHIDHYGMAGRFLKETGAELVMHETASEDLEVYRNPEKIAADLKEMFADHGVEAEVLEEITRYEDWRPFVSEVVEPTRTVAGNENFAIGDRTWEVVYTPGHARTHICLWSASDSILISGDHLLGSITPHIDFRRGDTDPLGEFLQSLEKVEQLGPDLVLPGHGRPFEDGAERARVVMRHHDRRLGAILQVIRREPATAQQITEAIFGADLIDFAHRLALGEALAHLAYLRRRGEIERIEVGGKYMYRKVSHRHDEDDDE
jgi:glyoxylase-like metal-dependent hydrolase (beta-lactamase superfamily II)